MSDCHEGNPALPVLNGKTGTSAPAVVALIGPPNSGKSTLFNRLTGLRQKVANFPGVTKQPDIFEAKSTIEELRAEMK